MAFPGGAGRRQRAPRSPRTFERPRGGGGGSRALLPQVGQGAAPPLAAAAPPRLAPHGKPAGAASRGGCCATRGLAPALSRNSVLAPRRTWRAAGRDPPLHKMETPRRGACAFRIPAVRGPAETRLGEAPGGVCAAPRPPPLRTAAGAAALPHRPRTSSRLLPQGGSTFPSGANAAAPPAARRHSPTGVGFPAGERSGEESRYQGVPFQLVLGI